MAAPRNNLALLLVESGRYEEAVQPGIDATRVDPSSPFAYANLAAAYIALGRLEEAEGLSLETVRFFSATGLSPLVGRQPILDCPNRDDGEVGTTVERHREPEGLAARGRLARRPRRRGAGGPLRVRDGRLGDYRGGRAGRGRAPQRSPGASR